MAQPIAPVMMLFYSAPRVFSVTIVLNILWAFVRERFVSIRAANMGALLVRGTWIVCIVVAALYALVGPYGFVVVLLFWPFIMRRFPEMPGGSVDETELRFIEKLRLENQPGETGASQ